MDNKQRS